MEDHPQGRHGRPRRPLAATLALVVSGAATLIYSTYVSGLAWQFATYCNPPPSGSSCLYAPPFGLSPDGFLLAALGGVVIGGLLVVLAGLLYSRSYLHNGIGVVVIVLALLTIPVYGGAIVGIVAAIVGAILAFAFAPTEGAGVHPWDSPGSGVEPNRAGPVARSHARILHAETPRPMREPSPLAPRAAPPRVSPTVTGGTGSSKAEPGVSVAGRAPPSRTAPAQGGQPAVPWVPPAIPSAPIAPPRPPKALPDYPPWGPPTVGSPAQALSPRSDGRVPPPSWARETRPATAQLRTPPAAPTAPPAPSAPPPAPAPPADPNALPRARSWVCPNCRTRNAPWSTVCTNCKTPAPAPGTPEVRPTRR